MFNIKVSGVASHRSGLTLLNNLDFWKEKKHPNMVYMKHMRNPMNSTSGEKLLHK